MYHQITECQADIHTPWDIARHVGLVAKDFDSIKRLDIERDIGKYSILLHNPLFFSVKHGKLQP